MEYKSVLIPKAEERNYSIDELKDILKDIMVKFSGYDSQNHPEGYPEFDQKLPQVMFYMIYESYLNKLSLDDRKKIWSIIASGNDFRTKAEKLPELIRAMCPTYKTPKFSAKFVQKIYYGVPGGGKSHKAKEDTIGYKVFRTTFHPDTEYASFVGSYKPQMNDKSVVRDCSGMPVKGQNDTKIEYSFVPQIFAMAYLESWKRYLEKIKIKENLYKVAKQKESNCEETDSNINNELCNQQINQNSNCPICLLIEELNRGNCSAIFGDLFQLLDRNKDGFSEYSILADADFADYIKKELGADFSEYYEAIQENSDLTDAGTTIPSWNSAEIDNNQVRLCLPPTLSLVATMNTSDQSLFPMDSAFKRRWNWEYVPIDYKNPQSDFILKIDDSHKYRWCDFLKKVNDIIYKETRSEDKQMGNFFVKGDGNQEVDIEQFVSKVMFYLWSEVCKDNPKAKKSLYNYIVEKTNDEGTIEKAETKDFTFSSLFESNKVDVLDGFMRFLGLDNVAGEIICVDSSDIIGETEKQQWEHSIYSDELIEYINTSNESEFTKFKEIFKQTYKTHHNGFAVKVDFGGWITLSRNKDANLVCYGNSDSGLMKNIFNNNGEDIASATGIPADSLNNKRSESRWQFTDKQGQAKLANPHDLDKKKEYIWFVGNAVKLYETFKLYISEK